MRLKEGRAAPKFEVKDVVDRPIALSDFAGKKLMISFYRYASCPFCNLRVHKLIKIYPELQQRGLQIISFWQSSKETLLEYVGEQEPAFPLIPDPSLALYKRYGVERSWQAVAKAIVGHPGLLIDAMRSGFYGGRIDGKLDMVPADFLIGPDLTIQRAYYGSHVGDHLPIPELEQFLEQPAHASSASSLLVGGTR